MYPFRCLVGFRPRNGGMVEWRNGGMAEWRNGGMAEWQIVMDNGPSYSTQIELECGKSGKLHVHPVQFWVLAS